MNKGRKGPRLCGLARVTWTLALAACAARAPALSWQEESLGTSHAPPSATGPREHEGPPVPGAIESAPPAVVHAWPAPAPTARAHVGVLLPLSGDHQGLGRELRVAIELAIGRDPAWQFYDSGGSAGGAEAAVERAVAAGAVVLLGPVGVGESVAAARRAAAYGVPIALCGPADGADPAAGVFRFLTSPADEARAAARVAAERGFPSVGVLAPRDALGAEMARAFVAEATALDLPVTALATYDPSGEQIADDVKRLLGLDPATNPRLAQHLRRHGREGWKTFSPDVPFSLLYVPDRYDRAALVVAYLPFYGVELRTTDFPDLDMLRRKHGGRIPVVVQLLGSAGWHHPSLPIRGGDAVEGALAVDTFAGAAEVGGGDAFDAAFTARAGRAPSAAAAQVHDAATLVARAWASVPQPTPTALREALARADLQDGAAGPAVVGADGEITREVFVLEVDREEWVLAP